MLRLGFSGKDLTEGHFGAGMCSGLLLLKLPLGMKLKHRRRLLVSRGGERDLRGIRCGVGEKLSRNHF